MKRFLPAVLLTLVAVAVLLTVKACQDAPAMQEEHQETRKPVTSTSALAVPQTRRSEHGEPTTPSRKPTVAPTMPSPSSPRLVIYEVQPGDSLSAIAWKVHVPVAALYYWNQIVVGPWPDLITPGMPLIIGKVGT